MIKVQNGELLMKKYIKLKRVVPMLAIIILVAAIVPAMAGEVTLIGQVNDNYQLVANGQVYEIADTPSGKELAEDYIDAKVKVTGTIEEINEMKTIAVKKFELIPE